MGLGIIVGRVVFGVRAHRGIDQLGDDRERLRQRYAALAHPMAAEVVRWLDGADTVDRWVEEA